jgi:hypothetical protein
MTLWTLRVRNPPATDPPTRSLPRGMTARPALAHGRSLPSRRQRFARSLIFRPQRPYSRLLPAFHAPFAPAKPLRNATRVAMRGGSNRLRTDRAHRKRLPGLIAGRAMQCHSWAEVRRDLVRERAEHLRGHTNRVPGASMLRHPGQFTILQSQPEGPGMKSKVSPGIGFPHST